MIDEHKQIIKPNAPKGIPVDLEVGDMLVYSGCELEHWREPFEGDHCAQVFYIIITSMAPLALKTV